MTAQVRKVIIFSFVLVVLLVTTVGYGLYHTTLSRITKSVVLVATAVLLLTPVVVYRGISEIILPNAVVLLLAESWSDLRVYSQVWEPNLAALMFMLVFSAAIGYLTYGASVHKRLTRRVT